jgi:hypothetical protein
MWRCYPPISEAAKYTLRKVCEYLEDIPNINSGGCAVSALVIQSVLKTKHNIDSEIIYEFSCNCSICRESRTELENAINNKPYDKYETACSHALVKIDDTYIDCTGIQYKPDDSCTVSPDLVIESINYADWNSSFNRKFIPVILKQFNLNLPLKP